MAASWADKRLCRDCFEWASLSPVPSPSRVPCGTSMTEDRESPSRKGARRSGPSENTALLGGPRDSGTGGAVGPDPSALPDGCGCIEMAEYLAERRAGGADGVDDAAPETAAAAFLANIAPMTGADR